MTYVCLWSAEWEIAEAPLAEIAESLLDIAPRVVVEGRGVVWVDGRGLPAGRLAERLLEKLAEGREMGVRAGDVRAGVAEVPIAAELAARSGSSAITLVESGEEKEFLAPLSVDLLDPTPRLRALLAGVGVSRCGELADLDREAIEVRFGSECVMLWRRARADDPRRLFVPIPREKARASLDFVDYEVREAERLVFTANALLGNVCAVLVERGERAREITLLLCLSNGQSIEESVRAARASADRTFWLRRIQMVLDGLHLSDGVVGIELRVSVVEPGSATQGDLFDRGFATAAPVEEAVARLVDAQGPIFMEPRGCGHPLMERRTEWRVKEPGAAAESRGPAPASPPCLTLQLLSEPRPIAVKTRLRRGNALPTRFQDGGEWRALAEIGGPDRITGGRWEELPYAREYYRCVTESGALVWLYRDMMEDRWFLHGWWD